MRIALRTEAEVSAGQELGGLSVSAVERLSPVGYLLTLLARDRERTVQVPEQEGPNFSAYRSALRIFGQRNDFEQAYESIWRSREFKITRGEEGVSASFLDPKLQFVKFNWDYRNDELTLEVSDRRLNLKPNQVKDLEKVLLTRMENFGTFNM